MGMGARCGANWQPVARQPGNQCTCGQTGQASGEPGQIPETTHRQRGLEADFEEQAVQLENAEVLAGIAKAAADQHINLCHPMLRVEIAREDRVWQTGNIIKDGRALQYANITAIGRIVIMRVNQIEIFSVSTRQHNMFETASEQ